MSRKLTNVHRLRANGTETTSISIGADFTSETTNVQNADNIGLIFTWTGTSPVGELFVDVSNDDVSVASKISNWSTLEFGAQLTVTGNSDNGLVNINQVPFKWYRVRYVRASGTGTMTVDSTMKTAGA